MLRPTFVILLLLSTSCRRTATEAAAPAARVERTRIERVVVATGTIEPEKEVEVRPRTSGIVQTVHVKAGDHVEAEQPLVEIDRELFEAQLREAAARLEGSRVELKFAGLSRDRATALRRDGTIAAQEREQADSRFEQATAAVARDEATVEALSIQLRYATVIAPMAGTILDVDVKEGSAVAGVMTVAGGTRILTLADAGTLHLKGLVDENEVAHVQVGQAARIRTESFGDRVFAGTVAEIKPIGERQQNVTYFEVKVRVTDDAAHVLKPRMSGDADIVTGVVDDALVVPETALLYEGNDVFVERGQGKRVTKQKVVIGIVEGSRVQITDGLAEGDEVRVK